MILVSRGILVGIGIVIIITGIVIAAIISGDTGIDVNDNPISDSLDGTIKVGVLLPLTSILNEESKGALQATELSIADFNEHLESIDAQWRLEMVLEDTKANPSIAREKIELLHSQGINVMIGPATSAATAAVKEYADENDILIVSCCSSAHSLAVEDDNILRIVPSDISQGGALVQVISDQDVDAIVPIWRDDVWGNDLVEFTRTMFEEKGIVVSDGIAYDPTSFDSSESVRLLADQVSDHVDEYGLKNTIVIFFGFDEIAEFVSTATNYDVLGGVRWFGTTALTNNKDLVMDPITSRFASNVQFTTISIAESHNPIHNKVKNYILDNQIGVPSIFAYASYDVPKLVGEAILEIDSLDTTLLRDMIIEKSSTFSGAMGTSELNAAGDLKTSDYEIWSIKDGQWAQIGQYMHRLDSVEMKTSDLSGEIPVGVLVPLSGEISFLGEEANSGIRIAVDDFNRYLVESGQNWTMDIVVEDTQTNPVIALEKTTSLNAKGINVIVGPSTSASTKNVKGYADANNLVLISYSSSARSLAIPNDSVYRTVPDDGKLGPAIASTMRDQGITAIVIIHRADAWGDDLNKSTSENFVSLGGIVGDPIRYPSTSQEFSVSVSILAKQVQTLVDEHGADKVAVVLMGFIESLSIMQSAAQEDILDDVRWFGTNANTNVEPITSDPIGREFTTATRFTSFQLSPDNNPTTERVRDYVLSDIGRTPSVYAYTAYDAIWITGLSMMKSQSTDPSAIKSVIMSVANDHMGAVGSTRLNTAGDLDTSDYDIWMAADGEWSIIGKYLSSDRSVTWQ